MSKSITSLAFTKTFTYRVLAMGATSLVAFGVTGDWVISGMIGVFDLIVKSGLYLIHELLWLKRLHP